MIQRILIMLSLLLATATAVEAQNDSTTHTLPELSYDALRLLSFGNDGTEAPDLTTYVTDKADVLTKAQEIALTNELQKYYREGDVQVMIVTTNDYEGLETTDYGERYLNFNDRAAVLLVNPTETDSARRAAIVPGRDFKYYELNEATCQAIINQKVIPAIDSTGYFMGVVRGMIMTKMAMDRKFHISPTEEEIPFIYGILGVLFLLLILAAIIFALIQSVLNAANGSSDSYDSYSNGSSSGSSYTSRSYSRSSRSYGGGRFGGGGGGGSW